MPRPGAYARSGVDDITTGVRHEMEAGNRLPPAFRERQVLLLVERIEPMYWPALVVPKTHGRPEASLKDTTLRGLFTIGSTSAKVRPCLATWAMFSFSHTNAARAIRPLPCVWTPGLSLIDKICSRCVNSIKGISIIQGGHAGSSLDSSSESDLFACPGRDF